MKNNLVELIRYYYLCGNKTAKQMKTQNNIGNVALYATPKKMENLITNEVKQIAKEKAFSMPMGTYSRLKVNNEISDIVINPTSSGVWFHHEPNTIGKDISSKIVCFIYYKDLN